MPVEAGVEALELMGFRLTAEGGVVMLSPKSGLHPYFREWIRSNKAGVLGYLLARAKFQNDCHQSVITEKTAP